MTIVARVILELWAILEVFAMMQRMFGTPFLLRFIECLEKPWLVKP